MYPSKAELLTDWLELLRSGQYQQTRNVLYDGEGYCCLGVAAEGIFNVEWEQSNNDWFEYSVGNEYACDNELIGSHAEALGLEREVTEEETKVYSGIVEFIVEDWEEDAQSEILATLHDMSDDTSRETWLILLNDAGFSFDDIAQFVTLAGWIPEAKAEERIAKLAALTQEMEAE